jgi:predicted dehydrogenase
VACGRRRSGHPGGQRNCAQLSARRDRHRRRHARFYFLGDYAAHPDGALSWRFQRARGGNGVLGDLASHGVDLVRYLLGEVESVFADTAIFIA